MVKYKEIGKRLYSIEGHITPDIAHNANWLFFVFGDNEERRGKGGQACIRGVLNTIGLRTKKAPGRYARDYWSDEHYYENVRKIEEDMLVIYSLWDQGKRIGLFAGGYGTGLADLEKRAPKTNAYLQSAITSFINHTNQ